MSKVLLTGGAGYIGSHCAKALRAFGRDSIVVDNLSTGRRDFLRWGEFHQADIRDRAALDAIFARNEIDVVMHFAGLSAVPESIRRPDLYYDVNVNGTRVLLDAMVAAGVDKIVFSSSCAIYGTPAELPVREITPVRPLSPYGYSKAVCEQMLDDYAAAFGLKAARLRYFNAAGADPDGEIGEDHDVETRLIPLALDALTKRRPSFSIFGTDYDTPDGTAVRDYVHVVDLVDAHLKALELLEGGAETFSVNLGSESGASVKEVVSMIEAVTGQRVPASISPRRPGDPPLLVADSRKAKEVLEWRPSRSGLRDIVGDAWRWHQRRFGLAAQAKNSHERA